MVTRLADICARKELVDIAQAHLGAVDGILARAVAEGRALDGHFIKIYLELPVPAQAAKLSNTMTTAARFALGTVWEPPQMRSSARLPRILFIDCSPSAKRNASATFDLPEPFGTTIAVVELESQDRLLGERFKSDYFKPL